MTPRTPVEGSEEGIASIFRVEQRTIKISLLVVPSSCGGQACSRYRTIYMPAEIHGLWKPIKRQSQRRPAIGRIRADNFLPSEGFQGARKNVIIVTIELMWIYTSTPPYVFMV
jgi:hypothetical protein